MLEENALVALTTSLEEIPPNIRKALGCFEQEKQKAEIILGAYYVQYKEQRETNRLLKELTDNLSNDRLVTATSLSNFFLINSSLLTGFYLHNNKIFFNSQVVDENTASLAKLSIKLESWYGNKDISYSVLLQAIKRYLLKSQFQEESITNEVAEYIEDYLTGGKTKKRRRISLKELKHQFPEHTPEKLKTMVASTGNYTVIKTTQGIFFKEKP